MDIPHTNIDAVFKESLTIFKDKTLDFLGITGIPPITELLGAEGIQIELKWDSGDLVFGTSDRRGLNLEEEVALSRDDLLRFCGYNTSLSRMHNREFITVIFVKTPTNLTGIETEQLSFRPLIVQCSKIDGDAVLAKLKKAVAEKRPINELEAIFLPLFHSKKLSLTQLFVESKKLIQAMEADDKRKHKILALLITLAGKEVDKEQLDVALEEVMVMGNAFIEFFEERGEKRGIKLGEERGIKLGEERGEERGIKLGEERGIKLGEERGIKLGEERGIKLGEERGKERSKEEIAKKLLALGIDNLDIVEATGISPERIREMRKAAV